MASIETKSAAGSSGFSGQSEYNKQAKLIDKMAQDAVTSGAPSMAIMDITPTLAQVLLDRNPENRKIRNRFVDSLEFQIKNDLWVFNGEPIIVADTGELNDGQNRLSAVIQSQMAIKSVVIVGVPRESRKSLDQGQNRTTGDILGMLSHGYPNELAAAAGYVINYRNHGWLSQSKASRRTNRHEILAFVTDHPGIERSLQVAVQTFNRSFGSKGLMAGIHFILSGVAKHEDVDNFFFLLFEGANLGVDNPILHLRNRLSTVVGPRSSLNDQRTELVFRAWNAWRLEEPMARLRLSGKMPDLVG